MINPHNAPDAWEIRALNAFENGVAEVSEVNAVEGSQHLRLMRPLITEQGCLKCHEYQGYQVGDVRGGISVSVPLSKVAGTHDMQIAGGAVAHGAIWLFGLGMLSVGSRKLSRSEHALRESEECYRTVADYTADWEYWMMPDGTFRYMSPSCVTICGYSQDEFYRDPALMMQVIHPDDRSRYEQHAYGHHCKHTSESMDFRIVTSSGSTRWISHVCRVVYGGDGKMNGIRASNRDITDRKQAEEALHEQTLQLEDEMAERQMAQETLQEQAVVLEEQITEIRQAEEAIRMSEEKFSKAFDNAPIMMTVSTMDDGTYLDVNKKFSELSGFSYAEAVGKKSDQLGWISAEQRQQLMVQLHNTGSVPGVELQLCTKEGNSIICVYYAEIITVDGRPCLLALAHDVTEHKIMEEHLRHSQKMEAIGQLAGGVAHDFNNILTVIMGYGNLLQMNPQLEQLQLEEVNQIVAASERAARLTRGLLTFSRKEPMNFEHLNLNDIVKHVQKFLVRVIGEDIQLNIQCSDLKIMVNVDATHIEQVLINLATNSRDALPKGGAITIGTGLDTIGETFVHTHGYGLPGEYACITIADNGCGMDESIRKKIFEPFFTTKEVGKGTGLGMAIVYGIIKQHNGYITLQSDVGVGTEFRIYLPLSSTAQGQRKEIIARIAPKRGTETILLVEDDPSVRGVIKRILVTNGYQLILAYDGQDAVEKFMAHRKDIALVLMDMIMPLKNGQEALEEIRMIEPKVKAFYLSGYTADFIRSRGVDDEEVEVISKPVHPIEFLHKVRDMLDRDERGNRHYAEAT